MERGQKTGLSTVVLIGAFLVSAGMARADMAEMKLYKEAFPGESVKCISCHIDAMPKKDDGKHELNDYGIAVKNEAKAEAEAAKTAQTEEAKPTVDTYKKVGKVEDFVKK